MMADFFPDTAELQKQRTGKEKLAREQVIGEFYRKMQALGEPFDEAWSRRDRACGSYKPLNTRAYMINYRLGGMAGSAPLTAWVSGHRIFYYMFDETKTDLPRETRILEFSERNPGLIAPQEWEGLVAGMNERLKGSKN